MKLTKSELKEMIKKMVMEALNESVSNASKSKNRKTLSESRSDQEIEKCAQHIARARRLQLCPYDDIDEVVGFFSDGVSVAMCPENSETGECTDCPVFTEEEFWEYLDESLNEDVASSIPAQPIPREELYSSIEAVKPGTYVKVGYLNDITKSMVASKYAGGRKAEDSDPVVVIYKATEVYGRCGVAHEDIQAVKDKRAAGIERKGNRYEMETELENKIYKVPTTGSELLQIYPRSKSDIKVKYFISVNDEDLREATREELAMYARGSALNTGRKEFDPTAPMRFNLSKIYLFKDLGHSII